MENDLTTKKRILRIYLKRLSADNVQEYFENHLRSYYYFRSENIETQSGENIPRGFDRFLNTLPTEKGEDQKPIVFKTDLKTKKGFRIEERDFIEIELSKINNLCKGVDLTTDLDLKKSVELYTDFLRKKLSKSNIDVIDNQAIEVVNKKRKAISDCLHHNNKDALMAKLHELLDEQNSGREVAKVLETLEDVNYLIRGTYSVPEVIVEFQLKCSRQSITNYLNKGTITGQEKKQIKDMLP